MSARKLFAVIAAIAGVAFSVGINAQTISTYAGGGAFVNAPALKVAAPYPAGAAVAPDGTVYYPAGNSVYHLNPVAGTVTPVAVRPRSLRPRRPWRARPKVPKGAPWSSRN